MYAATSPLNSFRSTGNSASKHRTDRAPGRPGRRSRPGVRHPVDGSIDDGDDVGQRAVVGKELPAVDPDARVTQRVRVQELRVVVREPVSSDPSEGRLQNVEEDRGVGHGAGHGPGGVLTVRDRDDPLLRHEAHGRLQPDHQVVPGGRDDRPVGLGPDGDGAQVRRRTDRRSGARPGRVEAQQVRVTREAAASAPSLEVVRLDGETLGGEAAEVGPFGEVRLAEDHGTGSAQPLDDGASRGTTLPDEREGTRRRLHAVVGRDVVLHEHGIRAAARARGRHAALRPDAWRSDASGFVSITAPRSGLKRSIRLR